MTKEIPIGSWNELETRFRRLRPVDLACRGQAMKHDKILPRIDRCLQLHDLHERLRMERALCQRFREHAPIYLSDVERVYLKTRWLELVVMQHYGAPTRLLDWTKSPWVATFFAASDGWEKDGYVYIFRRDRLEELVQQRVGSELSNLVWGPHGTDLGSSDTMWDTAQANDRLFDGATVSRLSRWVTTFYCRQAHFPRLIAQQGLFTFASKPNVDHWNAIRKLLGERERWVFKIAAKAKPEILRRLNVIGLNGATLFPGADGIGRSLEGFARAWHLRPRPSQFSGR